MSPIKGFRWLCAREETLRHTKQNWESGQLGKNFSFSSRRLTPSLVGLGEATVPSIAAHIRRSFLHTAGENIDLCREMVKSWLTDQSKERNMIDMPSSILDKLCSVKKLSNTADPSEYYFQMQLAFSIIGTVFLMP